MRYQIVCFAGLGIGLLVFGQDVSAAPAATPPATRTVAPTPMPVPERTATPVPITGIRPISTEKGHKMAQANKLIWWGAGFGIFGGVVAVAGAALIAHGYGPGGDDLYYMTGYGVLGIGLAIVLATSPVWIVGLVKKGKAAEVDASKKILPKSSPVVDLLHRRDYRRFMQRSGPPAVPVLSYGFRF